MDSFHLFHWQIFKKKKKLFTSKKHLVFIGFFSSVHIQKKKKTHTHNRQSQCLLRESISLCFLKYGSEISYCVSLKWENLKRCESLHSLYQIQSCYHLKEKSSQVDLGV